MIEIGTQKNNIMEQTKICHACGDDKPIGDYYSYVTPKGKTQVHNTCKVCYIAKNNARIRSLNKQEKKCEIKINREVDLKKAILFHKEFVARKLIENHIINK